jgi:DNA polymerase
MPRHILHRDIETRSTLDLTEVGAWRYAAEPTTDVWCVGYAVDDDPPQIWTPDQPIPEVFLVAANDPDWIVVAHNDQFETAIEQRVLAPRFGWPLVPIERHRCSMTMTLASALPGKLKAAAEALGIPRGKDVEGARLMRVMSRPRKPRQGENPAGVHWHNDPEKFERLYAYCRRDVELERELFRRLPPLTDSEQALWVLDAQINQRGFHTDGQLLAAASRIAAAAGQAAQEELARITAGALTSTDQVKALQTWLGEHGCEVKDLRKPTLGHALRRKGLNPTVRRVIELRIGAAHAAAAKIDTLLAWRDADGRVRGTLRFCGAGTGRWTGHGPQPQNFKRDGDGIEAKLAAVATGDLAHVQKLYPQPLEIVGDIARGMICAAPGHRLLVGDFSGIESRVLASVSGQQSKLDQWTRFDRTGDPKDEPYYILGRNCGQSEESARKIGKTADLAFGYMGGAGAWDRLAPEDESSDEDKRRYQQTWRRMHPQTVQFWTGINRTAINAVRKPGTAFRCRQLTAIYDGKVFLRITLPSGRSLSYPSPRLAIDKFGNATIMFKDNAAGKFVDCRYGQGAYGGLWTENIVQAVSRDLLAAAVTRLEAAGYHIVLHVHDEIVAEVPENFGSVEEFQRILTTLPTWADDLPIAAKARAGARFCKPEMPAAKPGIAISDDLSIPGFLLRCPAPPIAADADEEVADHKPDDERAAESELDQGAIDKDDHDNTAAKPATGNGNDHDASHDSGDGYASGEQPQGNCTAIYIYRDAAAVPYLRVIRTSAKKFWQSRWDNGRWVKGKPPGPKIPYRLPELIAAAPDIPVFICEGEKDTDNVCRAQPDQHHE